MRERSSRGSSVVPLLALVEASKQAFKIRPGDLEIINLFSGEEIHQQTRRMGQDQDESQLLAHATRHFAHLDSQVQIKSGRQRSPRLAEIPSPDSSEKRQCRRSVHPRWQPQITRDIADVFFDLLAL